MYAVIRKNVYDQGKVARAQQQLKEFQELHAGLAGYRGSISVDAGDGVIIALNLWESEGHAMAALSTLGPEVGRLLEPLMATESTLVGAGPVVANDVS